MRVLVFVAIIMIAACGKSEEQKRAEQAAEEIKKAAEAISDAAAKAGTAAAAQGSADMAKAMQDMAAAMSGSPDGKPVEPVAYQTLQTQIPKVAGWEMGEIEGQRMTSPVPFSQVETDYRKGDSSVEVTIVDTGFSQMLVAPWSMMLATGYGRESSSGYEKSTTISGNPAIEKWDSRDKRGELNILVGKRFMVTVDGQGLSDIKDVHAFAAAMDFNAIAAMK